MNYETVWCKTELPKYVIDSFIEECKNTVTEKAHLKNKISNPDKRNSKIHWIENTHWISGFANHYITQANNGVFNYDLEGFNDKHLQYTTYSEGEFYNWHVDTINDDHLSSIRKLSFTIQLSDPEEYSGGELQFMDVSDNLFFAPKERGTIIIFDSRTKHRVKKVRSGCRKSLVGWVEGPRWR